MMRPYLYALLLATACGSAIHAQPVELKWKFEKGKTFYEEHTTETKQAMKVMGMDFTQSHRQSFYFAWTPRERDQDGNWLVQQKIEAIKMDLDIAGNKIAYDSTKPPAAGNTLADFFHALIGSEFNTTVSPNFQVIKIGGKEEFLKKLVAANQQTEPMLRQSLTDDTLKQMTDPALAVAPDKPVSAGESWTKKNQLSMGQNGSYDLTHKYTYEGLDAQDKNLARIKVDVAVKFAPPAPAAAGQLPFKIKKADLKTSEGHGMVWFDIARGRVARSEVELKMVGTLSIEVSGNTTEVDLNQTQKTIIRTMDESPIAKK